MKLKILQSMLILLSTGGVLFVGISILYLENGTKLTTSRNKFSTDHNKGYFAPRKIVNRNNHSITGGGTTHSRKSRKFSTLLWRKEMLGIVETTPNLWGFREGEREGETLFGRVEDQRNWTIRIANTSFIKNAKPKKIVVFLEEEESYIVPTRLVCPYAPHFESRCDLVLVGFPWRDLLRYGSTEIVPEIQNYRKNGIEAVIGLRNGYWNYGPFLEPILPAPIQQIFVVYESPCHTETAELGRTKALLANYWRGSDIVIPPHRYIRMSEAKKLHSGFEEIVHIQPNDTKPGGVAAMITNCVFSKNRRLELIDELKKYINVDFYGKCGDLHCPNTPDCFQHLRANYKFFLAFENCNCVDYVTEKFFVNSLLHGLVPVVMGGTKKNYEEAAPPDSFIHFDDFSTPKELAEYLNGLDQNETLYKKYLKWRDDEDEWILSHDGHADLFCRTCALLYYKDFKTPPPWPSRTTSYKNVAKCATSGDWHWDLSKSQIHNKTCKGKECF